MAKKKRRPNIPQATLDQVRRQVQSQGTPIQKPTTESPASLRKAAARPSATVTTEADLRTQYAYVITDLRNMAILSGAFLLGLVVLSLFL